MADPSTGRSLSDQEARRVTDLRAADTEEIARIDGLSSVPFGTEKTAEDWVETAGWWIRELGDALPEASPMFKALVDVLKECQRRGTERDRLRVEKDHLYAEMTELRVENGRLKRALDCVERWAQEQHDYCWPPHLKDETPERVNELRGPCATYGAVVYELVVSSVKRHREVALSFDETNLPKGDLMRRPEDLPDDAFSIRWDESMGCYRVSTPSLGQSGERVWVVPADTYQRAVEALQSIYDRHHMAGDGTAGKVSGDALRALGIDPDEQEASDA